jgi:hypothetical protein
MTYWIMCVALTTRLRMLLADTLLLGAVATRCQAHTLIAPVTSGGEIPPGSPAGPRAVTAADEPVLRAPVTVQPSAHDSPGSAEAGQLQYLMLRAYGTDLAFLSKRSQDVQDTAGLWWWHGRVVVPSDAALRHRIFGWTQRNKMGECFFRLGYKASQNCPRFQGSVGVCAAHEARPLIKYIHLVPTTGLLPQRALRGYL